MNGALVCYSIWDCKLCKDRKSVYREELLRDIHTQDEAGRDREDKKGDVRKEVRGLCHKRKS